MYPALEETNFKLPGQTGFYRGKVREVYEIDRKFLVMVVTDRISAFDRILSRPVPYKGEVLNLLASKFLGETRELVPNWLMDVPDPAVSIGLKCKPVPVEMVIRGYLCGHAWREYKSGKKYISGVSFPEGMKQFEPFPEPIVTPTTKAREGHDEDTSREEIIEQGIVDAGLYDKLEKLTRQLFKQGQEMAEKRGLILADTKYEFGILNGEVYLIDEVHTPDSSRYFYRKKYNDKLKKGEAPRQLSKEFVRNWLMEHNFSGRSGQIMPEMEDMMVEKVMNRYVELFENVSGVKFPFSNRDALLKRVEVNIEQSLKRLRTINMENPGTDKE